MNYRLGILTLVLAVMTAYADFCTKAAVIN